MEAKRKRKKTHEREKDVWSPFLSSALGFCGHQVFVSRFRLEVDQDQRSLPHFRCFLYLAVDLYWHQWMGHVFVPTESRLQCGDIPTSIDFLIFCQKIKRTSGISPLITTANRSFPACFSHIDERYIKQQIPLRAHQDKKRR